ncbi:MAG: hypothetical protein ACKOF3_05590, partial [Spartobacteria bacterium]
MQSHFRPVNEESQTIQTNQHRAALVTHHAHGQWQVDSESRNQQNNDDRPGECEILPEHTLRMSSGGQQVRNVFLLVAH